MTNNKLLAGEYVAVLDDIAKWRKVVTGNLTYYGCNNVTYFETKEGITTTYDPNTTKLDIAFLDINLNIQDDQNKEGLEVCRFFKENAPSTTIVVMIFLENIAKEARKSGADFFIQKEHFIQDFNTFVQQYIKKNL